MSVSRFLLHSIITVHRAMGCQRVWSLCMHRCDALSLMSLLASSLTSWQSQQAAAARARCVQRSIVFCFCAAQQRPAGKCAAGACRTQRGSTGSTTSLHNIPTQILRHLQLSVRGVRQANSAILSKASLQDSESNTRGAISESCNFVQYTF